MTTKTIEIDEAQSHFAELVSLAEAGTEVILTKNHAPLARIVPMADGSRPRIAGLHAGSITTTDDFDDPLPDSFWTGAS